VATTWYFRNTSASGNMPTGELSTDTDNVPTLPADKNTVLNMLATKGASQFTKLQALSYSVAYYTMIRLFISPPLAAQTLAGGQAGFKVGIGTKESSVSMNQFRRTFVYIWRQGSGNVKTILVPTQCGTEHTTAERGCVITAAGAAGDFSILNGDRIVVEIWVYCNSTTSYSSSTYYDGTTDVVEASTTSDACGFFYSPQTLTLYQVPLAGVVNGITSVAGMIKPSRRVVGVAVGVSAVSGVAKASRKLAGVVTCLGTAAGLAKTTRRIAGLASGEATAIGSLTVTLPEILLAGVVSGVASAVGTIRCLRPVAGLSMGLANVSGGVKMARKVSGTVAGTGQVSGLVRVSQRLVGAISGMASVSGIVKASRKLAGAIAGMASTTGLAKVSRNLSGLSAGLAAVSGVAKVNRGVAGAVVGVASVSGLAKVNRALAGAVAGAAAVFGEAKVVSRLAGFVSGVVSVSGQLRTGVFEYLAGIVSGESSITGNLTVEQIVSGSARKLRWILLRG